MKQRFGDAVSVEAKPIRFDFDYPLPPEGVFEFFKRYFGPTQVAYSKLDAAQQPEYKSALVKLWSEHNKATDGDSTQVEVEYLEVRARKK